MANTKKKAKSRESKKKKISEATPRHLLRGYVGRPTLTRGRVWVKKAGMFMDYENYNTKGRADKQVFI